MQTIDHVLATNEKILWTDKPQFLPFILTTMPAYVVGLAYGLAMGVVIVILGSKSMTSLYVLFMLFMAVFILGRAWLTHRTVSYAITDKRTLIGGGIIGHDFVSVEHDKVTSTSVKVGLADKLVGRNSGSVLIVHPAMQFNKYGVPLPTRLTGITNPNQVYQFLNKVSHDVRTDIQSPNALREPTNSGYTVNPTLETK